jgi:DnaJ-class molecular chaperone
METCENCKGSGRVTCPDCDGLGEVEQFCGRRNCSNEEAAEEAGKFEDVICERCNGWGELECSECAGEGVNEV